jgi:hypothetical protein
LHGVVGGVAEQLARGVGESDRQIAVARVASYPLGRDVQGDALLVGLEDGAAATFVITSRTPDEARLAILDLDVTATELRRKELRRDEAAGEWRPSEAPGPSQ